MYIGWNTILVRIPKYRRRILNPSVKAYVLKLFPKVLEMMLGCEMVEQNVRKDHLHLVMVIPPKYVGMAIRSYFLSTMI